MMLSYKGERDIRGETMGETKGETRREIGREIRRETRREIREETGFEFRDSPIVSARDFLFFLLLVQPDIPPLCAPPYLRRSVRVRRRVWVRRRGEKARGGR